MAGAYPNIVSYYGSKSNLSSWIVSYFPEHDVYLEPFAGSAAILFAKKPSKLEIINDLDKSVVNFWSVVRNKPLELIEMLENTPYAKEEYINCRDSLRGGFWKDDVEMARRFFVACNCSFNASLRSKIGFSRSTEAYHAPNSFYKKVLSIKDIVERLRFVEIENVDALSVIDRWSDSDAKVVTYVDPPYIASQLNYTGNYTFRSGTDNFHKILLNKLCAFRGAVILSGYSCDLYDELLADWVRYDRVVQVASSAQPGAQGLQRTESIWVKRGWWQDDSLFELLTTASLSEFKL